MIDLVEVVSGVRVPEWVLQAGFEYGTLRELAEGLRNALWTDLQLYADTETLIVHVGGDHVGSLESSLEVESWQPGVPYETITLSHSMHADLEAVRVENMPDSEYATWHCDCEEYCDQNHGEGRLDLYVFKPSFHEAAVALGSQVSADTPRPTTTHTVRTRKRRIPR